MPTLTTVRPAQGLVTISAAARELGVARPTINSLVLWGKLRGQAVGDRLWIDRDSLDALKAARGQRAPTAA